MEKPSTTRLLIAMFSAALLLMSACGSSAQVAAGTSDSTAAQQASTDSAPAAEVRLNGAPLASKMGVCDAFDPAFIEQWVGIEDMIYASFGAQSDGCSWNGDNWDTTHRAALVSMIVHSQQSFEGKSAKFAPFVGGPDGSFIHNDVHVYLEHEGTYVSFWVIPTREGLDESTHPADNVDLYNEVINAMLPALNGIEKA